MTQPQEQPQALAGGPAGQGLAGERARALASLAVTLLALFNSALSLSGHNPLPWSQAEVYQAASGLLAVAATGWSWWKNQNLTRAAVVAQKVLDGVKAHPAQGTGTTGTTDTTRREDTR